MADKTYEIEVKTTSDTEGVTSVQDALRETKSEAEATQEALQEAFSEATSEVERLEDALSEAHINGDDIEADIIADELYEARQKAEELEDALNNVGSTTFDNATSEAGELADELDRTKESAEEVGVNLDLLDASAMMGIASEISAMGSSAENMAQEMNNASITVGQLATATGVAEPQMVSLINHISNATFPQNEAMAYVQALNQMGVSADKLGDSATNMDKINDATHIGYNNAIQLTQGLRSVGIEADQLPASFNAIAFAHTKVSGGTETLTRVLQRQASTINEYGMNVDQVVLIMQKLSEKGVQGKKMGSELSKVLKDNNGDLRAIEQQLGMTSGALDNASQTTGQFNGKLQELADQEAEHKTPLEQINALWEDFALSLSWAITPITSVMGLLGEMGSVALHINSLITLGRTIRDWERLQGVFNTVKGGMSSLGTAVTGLGTRVRATATAFLNLSRTLISSVISAVRTAVTSFANLAKEVLLSGLNALKSAGMWVIQKAQVLASAIANGVATASQWALNIAMSMNPIGILIIAIAGLIAILGYLYFNNEQVRGAIDGLGQALMGIATIIWDSLVSAWDTLTSALQGFWDYVVGLGEGITSTVGLTSSNVINGIIGFLAFWFTLPIQISVAFVNILAQALGFGNNFVQRLVSAGSRAVSNFISYISQIPAKLGAELGNALNKVNEWASTLPQKFWEAGVNAVKNFLNALGINSPGTMQRMIVWEVSEMGRRIPYESRQLLSNVSEMGKNVVDAFGDPSLEIGTNISNAEVGNGSLASSNQNSTSTVNLTLNVGSVDRQERVDEIITTIRDYFEWDNKTAGRTI